MRDGLLPHFVREKARPMGSDRLSIETVFDAVPETQAMRVVRSSDIKEHIPELLDEVERGEVIVITRNGNRIARIVPETRRNTEEIGRAIEAIKLFGRQSGEISVSEILSARDEGRRI